MFHQIIFFSTLPSWILFIYLKKRADSLISQNPPATYKTFNCAHRPMGKKYHAKKLLKHLQNDPSIDPDSPGLQGPQKDKKIVKEPRTKDTILSDIELQIVDMFSRSFTNGEIGVKYPQQKKKGMMRLMNFCFRTIIEEAELYIGPSLQKEAQGPKCLDKKERTIFYLSSNYRYKHIQKSLLEDFKILCKNYVKYHCLEHLDPKFVEKFYKKVIHNDFCLQTSDPFKNKTFKPQQQEDLDDDDEKLESQPVRPRAKSPKKTPKTQKDETTPVKKTGAKRGRKRKNFPLEADQLKAGNQYRTGQKDDHEMSLASMIEPSEREAKSNKICIEKINIYLGYDSNIHGKKLTPEQQLAKIEAHPYARIEVEQNEGRAQKKKWTNDMEAELIDQFMNTSATSPNIIIRNLMKKFGRNKLFVEAEIQAKRKEMFKTSIHKFIKAFEGKTLCSEEAVKKMEVSLRNMSLEPKNYFIASFMHDFYFKEVQAISVTLLSEYINKLNKEETATERGHSQLEAPEDDHVMDRKKILERQDLKYALTTMSKLVSNYSYDLVE